MSWLFLILAACSYDPTVGTLPDNVGRAFAPCQESEIRFLATKHNFQLSFEPCGKNAFGAFSWSPSGERLYFQLGQTGYVMNAGADDKRTLTVPTPSPIGKGDWITSARLALPIGPKETGGMNRVAVFSVDQQSVFYWDVNSPVIDQVLRAETPTQLLIVVAQKPTGPRQLLRMDLNDGSTTPAYEWLKDFDTVDFSPKPNLLVVGRGETVTVHDASTGKSSHSFQPATRGTVHSDGRWLMLEHLGEPVSIFYQRAWDDMTEAQRRRERQRAEKLAASLPDSYPTMVRPPTLSFADLNDDARWMLTSVYGTDFQWYEAQPYYGSFIFWGFEGKQFKRNVLLGQFGSRLRATEIGRDFMGVVPMNEAAKNRTPEKQDKPVK